MTPTIPLRVRTLVTNAPTRGKALFGLIARAGLSDQGFHYG